MKKPGKAYYMIARWRIAHPPATLRLTSVKGCSAIRTKRIPLYSKRTRAARNHPVAHQDLGQSAGIEII